MEPGPEFTAAPGKPTTQPTLPMNLGSPESCRRFPLSPSEGERGPTWISGTQCASECRGVLSPSRSSSDEGGATSSFGEGLETTGPICTSAIRPALSSRPSAWRDRNNSTFTCTWVLRITRAIPATLMSSAYRSHRTWNCASGKRRRASPHKFCRSSCRASNSEGSLSSGRSGADSAAAAGGVAR